MSTVTLGVKVDEALRGRLKQLAESMGCTPHWLHKQALVTYIEAIERGQVPQDIDHRPGSDAPEASGESDPQMPFYAFAQDIQPQSVLRSAITAAYRRPEPECVAMLLDQAEVEQAEPVRALATRLVGALRDKRTGGGVEGVIQEFSLSSQEAATIDSSLTRPLSSLAASVNKFAWSANWWPLKRTTSTAAALTR